MVALLGTVLTAPRPVFAQQDHSPPAPEVQTPTSSCGVVNAAGNLFMIVAERDGPPDCTQYLSDTFPNTVDPGRVDAAAQLETLCRAWSDHSEISFHWTSAGISPMVAPSVRRFAVQNSCQSLSDFAAGHNWEYTLVAADES